MTRTANASMEKLGSLYKRRSFMQNKLRLQRETMVRERRQSDLQAVIKTRQDLQAINQEIDVLRDTDY